MPSFDIDVGIMTGKSKNNDFVNIPVVHDYLALICPKGHALYDQEHIRPMELNGEIFSLHEEGSCPRKTLDAMIHNCTINIHKRWESSSVSIIKKSVLRHDCLALTSALAFRAVKSAAGLVHRLSYRWRTAGSDHPFGLSQTKGVNKTAQSTQVYI